MIIYGVVIDTSEMADREAIDQLERDLPGNVQLVTGYSCSAYEPEMAVFGIVLDKMSALFNPLSLAEIIEVSEKLTDEDKAEVAIALKEFEVEGTPEIYFFDETDD